MSVKLEWRLTSLWFADMWSLSKNIGGDALPDYMLCSACCESLGCADSGRFSHAAAALLALAALSPASPAQLSLFKGDVWLWPLTPDTAGNVDLWLQRFGSAWRKYLPVICWLAEKHPETWADVLNTVTHTQADALSLDAYCEFFRWHSCSSG